MKTGLITSIQRFSLNDGPGIRTTVFFKGCNLRCQWCHNPETLNFGNDLLVDLSKCIGCGHCVAVCPTNAHQRVEGGVTFDRTRCTACGKCAEICFPGAMEMAGKRMSVEDVMAEIRQDTAYYADSNGGVTLSGGEVFGQREFAAALVSACKEAGIPIAVETNLAWDFDAVRPILEELDLIMFDLKIADSVAHERWTGVDNAQILGNLGKLDELGIPLIARTPLIPGATDCAENIAAIAKRLAGLKNLVRYELLNFNPLGDSKYTALAMDNVFAHVKPLTEEKVSGLVKIAEAFGLQVIVG